MVFLVWLLRLLLAAQGNAAPPPPKQHVDFAKDVRPILEKHCQPCHFEGGKMYARLPFDKAETIVKLDTKLFTRIRNEDEQAVIRAFLASRR